MFGNKVKKAVESLNKHLGQLSDELKSPSNNDNNNDIKDASNDDDNNYKKYISKIAKDMLSIHFFLYGDAENQPKADEIRQLVPMLLDQKTNIFLKLSIYMEHMTFESKKHCAAIMSYLIRRCNKNGCDKYINNNTIIVVNLLKGYSKQGLAQNVGSVLREMSKRPELGKLLFNIKIKITNNDMIFELLNLVNNPSFDIASDAFNTLETLLTRNKVLCSEYLKINYDKFFAKFHQLIQSDNYVTQRQFLKLLSALLFEKKNFNTMIKYVNQKNNLKISMQLLKDKSKAISYEAFHIFKVFVANPKKERDVHIVLWKNRDKLIRFLSDFLKDKESEDQTFAEEKGIVIDHLQKLQKPPDFDNPRPNNNQQNKPNPNPNNNNDNNGSNIESKSNGNINNDNNNEQNGSNESNNNNNDNSVDIPNNKLESEDVIENDISPEGHNKPPINPERPKSTEGD